MSVFSLAVMLSIYRLPFLTLNVHAESSCAHESHPIKSLCTGCPPMYKGYLCASTTHYTDLTRGACGCGTDPNPPSFWTKTDFTAALNCKNLDPANPNLSWCPVNCAQCFRLCATGGTTNGVPPPNASQCITVQVENRCGDGYQQPTEAQWCRQEMSFQECAANAGSCASNGRATNNYGYAAHFDLQDVNHQIDQLGWNNVEVTFERVPCSTGKFGNWSQTCYCPPSQIPKLN